MLKLNLQKYFRLHGIQSPVYFLVSKGFNRCSAYNFVNGKVKNPGIKHIEKFCRIFDCTPNDLMEWSPADSKEKQLRLNELSPQNTPDMLSTLKTIPPAKALEFAKAVEELKKTFLNN
ncbi:MAG: helix-turn-helix transcriptional regulator [Ignavibacteria bacterium]